MTTLAEWQHRLASHFDLLARSRNERQPLFALEHGLASDEIAQLQAAVRQSAKRRDGDSKASLPWIVYATELGYRYSGDQYWQTFEDETPGWAEYWERDWLRSQFVHFHKKYHGVKPVSVWAQHFSIICWPIANALLPRDLQLQLARILYGLAYKLNKRLLESPEELGKLIADRAWDASSRFQNFAQESLLVGQIATALLLESGSTGNGRILPATLARIAADLNKHQASKTWLKSARDIARMRVSGASAPHHRPHEESQPERSNQAQNANLEASFVLRPSENGAWQPLIKLPSFVPLLDYLPSLRETLIQTRCVVAGTDGRPLARGRLLQGSQLIPLVVWPKDAEPLLRFEKSEPQLEFVLRTRLAMPSRRVWVFRVASDGMAYEIRAGTVRAGEKYVLLVVSQSSAMPSFSVPCAISCRDINAYLVELPTSLQPSYIEELHRAGVPVSAGIRVWPVGACAVSWDGEGRSEWLTSHRPCFAISSDQRLAGLEASNSQGTLALGTLDAGETAFLAFDPLLPGRHEIALRIPASLGQSARNLGLLEIFVRAPLPWEPGRTEHGPVLIDLDPIQPTLEDLREQRMQLSIRGPVGASVACVGRLTSTSGSNTHELSFGTLELPITPETWNRHVDQLFQLKAFAERYDQSSSFEIELQNRELGRFAIKFERETVPVRWMVRTRGKERQFAVSSDLTADQSLDVDAYSFATPDEKTTQDPARYQTWCAAPSSGGLFVARVGNFCASIILPPDVHDLRGLQVTPSLRTLQRSPSGIRSELKTVELWAGARLTGNLLSGSRQRRVIREMTRRIFATICGGKWHEIEVVIAEEAAKSSATGFRGRADESQIAMLIVSDAERLLQTPPQQRVDSLFEMCRAPLHLFRIWQHGVVKGYGTPEDPHWLLEFALRMASDPAGVAQWAGKHIDSALLCLLNQPAIARISRFSVIALCERAGASQSNASHLLYKGWEWL